MDREGTRAYRQLLLYTDLPAPPAAEEEAPASKSSLTSADSIRSGDEASDVAAETVKERARLQAVFQGRSG